MKRPLSQKLKSSKGFTLAETLVALALMVILLAISLLGIVSYVKNMKLTEMDSTAREVFLAAQNHLTSAEVTGKLGRVELEDRGELLETKPQDFPESLSWPGENQDEFYFIAYSAKDVGTQGNLETSILKDMLPFGAIDEAVRKDGAYIIEYNVKTASVYGVFYTDDALGISQADVLALENKYGRFDTTDGRIARRDYEKNGKRVTVGYYGGAMAENLEAKPMEEPLLDIANEEKLLVKITDSNYFKKEGGTQLLTDVTVTITGEESKKTKTIPLELNGNPFTPEKKFPTTDKWWTVEKTKSEDEKTDVLYYELSLDDLTTPGGQFAAIFTEFTPGENIKIDVKCKSDTVSTFRREATGTVNSLFAAAIMEGDQGNLSRSVDIDAVRHLQNLEPKISNINIKKEWGKACVNTANQLKNLNWEGELEWKNFYVGKSIYPFNSKSPIAQNSFYGMHNQTLFEYNGGKNSLENFVIKPSKEDTKAAAGLFRNIQAPLGNNNDKYTVKDLKLVNFDVKVENPLPAGALIGNVDGNLTVENVVVVDGKVESVSEGAGGLIGSINEYSSWATVKITNSAAATTVRGGVGFTGGFIGEIAGGKAEITKCYSSGRTKGGNYVDDNDSYSVKGKTQTGGFIGHVGQTDSWMPQPETVVNDCYSTCAVDALGYQAGGFVGSDTSTISKYRNCYATGLVKYYRPQSEGAFAYSLKTAQGNVSNCRYLGEINDKLDGLANQTYTGVVKVSYDQLSGGVDNSKGETYPFDQTHIDPLTHKGMVYPFPMVNNTGASDLLKATGVHYGDWPNESQVIEYINPTDVMFAYREGVWNTAYSTWYVKGVDKNGKSGVVYNSFPEGYVENKKKRPTGADSQYGLLIPKNSLGPSDFTGGGGAQGSGKDFFPNSFDGYLRINGKEYYFFPILGGEDDRNETSVWTITPHYHGAQDLGYQNVSFSFMSGYAATIDIGNIQ